MTNKLDKVLHRLREGMSWLEQQHKDRIEHGENPADVDREIAKIALSGVIEFILDSRIEAGPLHRLLGGLEALSAGSRAPGMFLPTRTRHRRRDSPNVEGIKGRLAAIMEFMQRKGRSRKEAAQWVARNLPSELNMRLGPTSARAIDSWLAKWGGKYGAAGSGRDGYRRMLDILTAQKSPPSEQQLKNMIASLARSLPS